MTDRELLEAAAKAAGLAAKWHPAKPGVRAMFWQTNVGEWNPLDDDGDALRLAVKLDMSSLMIWSHPKEAKRREFWTPNSGYDGGRGIATESEYKADPYAATRRAIVRAAAAMVKA